LTGLNKNKLKKQTRPHGHKTTEIMKTIKLISACIENMQKIGIPANIEVGTFKIISSGSLINWAGETGHYSGSVITFDLVFRPDHIQTLLKMGVKIDLDGCKMANLSEKAPRFKKGREAIKQGRLTPYYYMGNPENHVTGVVENWLKATATCQPYVLKELDKFCRDNHRDVVYVDNNHNLNEVGWKFPVKYPSAIPAEETFSRAIRRNAQGKTANQLQPIEKRALKLY